MKMHKTRTAVTALAAFAALSATQVHAQQITVGLSAEPTSADPHYHKLTPNEQLASAMFETLVAVDPQRNPMPGLAVEWHAEDELTWVLRLREGVKFSNGAEFGPDDVIFSMCRVLNNETSVAGSYTNLPSVLTAIEVTGDHEIVLRTERPMPLLPVQLSDIRIIWSGLVEHDELSFTPQEGCGVTSPWPTANDFVSGDAAIGTGPFRLEKYVRGNEVVLVRNDAYWGEAPDWERVRMVPATNAGPRVTGLLSGDYDFIENPPARDLPGIENAGGLDYVVTPSTRIIFLQLDQRDDSPFIETDDGSNPLQDVRVRRAISMAIDRQAIVDRIMDGVAVPANQFLPDGLFGTLDDPEALVYDPEGARALLAEAGYPDGFAITFHASNDRFINDGPVAQAITQFLSQVGIRVELDAMTASLFFPRRAKRDYSMSMGGWSNPTGEASSFLGQWLVTTDKDAGIGGSNYGAWSDLVLDELVIEALGTIDEDRREALLEEGVSRALETLPDIPLHFESTVWAFRDDLTYPGRADQMTLVQDIRLAE